MESDTTNSLYVLRDANSKIMQDALEGPYVENTTLSGIDPVDRKTFEKAQKAYAACMNDQSIKAYGVTPLRKMLDGFDTVFPLTNSNQDLTDALIWLFKKDVMSVVALKAVVSLLSFSTFD